MVPQTNVKIFFSFSCRFEARVNVVKISTAHDQNQQLNPALELKSLPTPAINLFTRSSLIQNIAL